MSYWDGTAFYRRKRHGRPPTFLRRGEPVWYLPANIGFGYVYGVDEGIPARVERKISPKGYVLISFNSKCGEPMTPRYVKRTMLRRRKVAQPTPKET